MYSDVEKSTRTYSCAFHYIYLCVRVFLFGYECLLIPKYNHCRYKSVGNKCIDTISINRIISFLISWYINVYGQNNRIKLCERIIDIRKKS